MPWIPVKRTRERLGMYFRYDPINEVVEIKDGDEIILIDLKAALRDYIQYLKSGDQGVFRAIPKRPIDRYGIIPSDDISA